MKHKHQPGKHVFPKGDGFIEDEIVVDIDERQQGVLRATFNSQEPFRQPHPFSIISSADEIGALKQGWKSKGQSHKFDRYESLRDTEYQILYHIGRNLSKIQTKDIDIDRGEITEFLESYDITSDVHPTQPHKEALDIYKQVETTDLAPSEVINIKQITTILAQEGEESKVEEAEEILDGYFDNIKDHPLVSKRKESVVEQNLSYQEARRIMTQRAEKLRRTSEEVFEEIDEETILDMQRAYLKLIWDNIESS